MLRLDLHGRPLLLPANTRAVVTYRNPKLTDGIQDDYTLPVDLPVEGNEVALGHVHHLQLRQRRLELSPAHLHHQGVPLHPGTLQVLGSTATSVRASFSAQGFAALLKGVGLRDALAAQQIDTTPDGGPVAHAKLVTMRDTPHPSHCFPLHHNPGLYGGANPQWKPQASTWSDSQSYAVDALVTWTVYEPIRREEVWQCVEATDPGEAPNDSPKWRRVVFGLVNSYDADEQAYDANSAAGNFYALVPWFRYDWVVRQALAHLGLEARGDWFTDHATPYLVLPNATPMDSEAPAEIWGAQQTDPATYGPDDWPVRLPLDNDGGDPYTDPADTYDPTARTFELQSAGRHDFRVYVEATFSNADFLAVSIRRASDDTVVPGGPGGFPATLVSPTSGTSHAHLFEFTVNFLPGDVGADFYIHAEPWNAGPFMAEYTLANCHATVVRYSLDGINSFARTILPARHVPEMPLGDFLEAVATTFGLEVVPDLERRAVHFRIKERVLRDNVPEFVQGANRAQRTLDISHRLAGPLELDHSRARPGVALRWPVVDGVEQEPTNSTLVAPVDRAAQLAKPTGPRQHTVVRSTRQLLRSQWAPEISEYVWALAGTYAPGMALGDTREMEPSELPIRALPMDELWVDGRKLLVPVLDLAGDSSFFAQEGGQLDLHVCVNLGPVATLEDGEPYPAAGSWGVDQAGAPRWGLLMAEQPAGAYPSWWDHYHARWAAALVRSEPLTTDLLLDHAFLRDPRRNDLLHLHGHTVVLEELPVEYRNDRAPLVSRGAYLRRIPPAAWGAAEPQVYTPTDTCPVGSVRLLLGEEVEGLGQLGAWGSEGYWSVRYNGGAPTVYANGNAHSYEGPGTYCIYPSDAEGNFDGSFTQSFALTGVELLNANYTALSGLTDAFGYSYVLPNPSTNFPVPNGGQGTVVIEGSTGSIDGHTIAFEQAEYENMFSVVIFGFSDNPTLRIVWPSSSPLLSDIGLGHATFLPQSMDALSELLDPLLAGNMITNNAVTTPTSASQAKRQDLYDNGWTLPDDWLTDLDT